MTQCFSLVGLKKIYSKLNIGEKITTKKRYFLYIAEKNIKFIYFLGIKYQAIKSNYT